MSIETLIRENRSCRRFDENQPVAHRTLNWMVDLARMSASAANLQPLKYVISTSPEKNHEIFSCLKWAGYLTDWSGPDVGERPTGYVVILNDTRIASSAGCDHGIAAQSMLLGAVEKGLAGCMIAAVNHPKLQRVLSISDDFEILLVVAVGVPLEVRRMVPMRPEGDVRYYRDADRVHHVPKREMSDIVIARFGDPEHSGRE